MFLTQVRSAGTRMAGVDPVLPFKICPDERAGSERKRGLDDVATDPLSIKNHALRQTGHAERFKQSFAAMFNLAALIAAVVLA